MGLSYQQLGRLAKGAGVPTKQLQRAAHIALAESDGDPNARNPKTGTYTSGPAPGTFDMGLWQINSQHRVDHPTWTEEWLKVPENNAEAMSVLSKNGQDWSPWNASKKDWERPGSGGGIFFLPGASVPDLTPGFDAKGIPIVGDVIKASDATTDALGVATDAIGDYYKFAFKSYQWLGNPHNWLRIGYVALGAGVVLVGLAKLIGYDSGLSPIGAVAKLGKTGGATPTPKPPAASKEVITPELKASLRKENAAASKRLLGESA